MNENTTDKKRKIRKTALMLFAVAFVFFFGFILLSVFRT